MLAQDENRYFEFLPVKRAKPVKSLYRIIGFLDTRTDTSCIGILRATQKKTVMRSEGLRGTIGTRDGAAFEDLAGYELQGFGFGHRGKQGHAGTEGFGVINEIVFIDQSGGDQTLDKAGAAMGDHGFAVLLFEPDDGTCQIAFYPGIYP